MVSEAFIGRGAGLTEPVIAGTLRERLQRTSPVRHPFSSSVSYPQQFPFPDF